MLQRPSYTDDAPLHLIFLYLIYLDLTLCYLTFLYLLFYYYFHSTSYHQRENVKRDESEAALNRPMQQRNGGRVTAGVHQCE